MTHFEIILWIQEHLVSIYQPVGSELLHVTYIDEQGEEHISIGKDLESIVLNINELDLVIQ